MLVNALEEEESRVTIVEDGQLLDFNYELSSREQSRGNIFKGVVTKIEPSLQAAFVDYGAERAGFLPVSEVREQAMAGKPADPRKPKIEEILKKKQEIMVQVVKEPVGTKGAALSTRIAIPGRYLVIMPGDRAGGVSRKIEDEGSRRKARDILKGLGAQDDMGIILRTAGMDRSMAEIKTDFLYLNKLWNTIMENYMRAKAPAMVYQESDVILRSIRDYFTPDVSEIVTDDNETFERILNFITAVMPNYQNRVRLYEANRPLFDTYGIEDQIHRLHEQRVRLKSGGEIVITQTEALVAVDVNSGRATKEKDVELTAFKTNSEAAREVARQLRLRDLGGLIVVDFIDMRQMKHVREVEKIMRDSMRSDKARIETTRISKLGLMEISRQRLKKSIHTTSFVNCPSCHGTGVVRSVETLALSVLRSIQARVALGDIEFVRGDLPADVLVYLLNAKRDELVRLQTTFDVKIQLNIRPERQSLSGPSYSSNPADWLEFHRRLRPRRQQTRVATVEEAVQATAQERKRMEIRQKEMAELARAKAEPQEVIDAILAGEDADEVRRRIAEREARQARDSIKAKGRSARHGATKLPPLGIDESEAIGGIVIGEDGAVVVEAAVEDAEEPQPPARARSGREDRGGRDERPPRRGRSRGNERPPRVNPEEEADAFGGFVLGEDGSLIIPVVTAPEPAGEEFEDDGNGNGDEDRDAGGRERGAGFEPRDGGDSAGSRRRRRRRRPRRGGREGGGRGDEDRGGREARSEAPAADAVRGIPLPSAD